MAQFNDSFCLHESLESNRHEICFDRPMFLPSRAHSDTDTVNVASFGIVDQLLVSTSLLGLITIIPVLTYLVTSAQAEFAKRQSTDGYRQPPILPYWLPFVGSLVTFIRYGPELCEFLLKEYGSKMPVGIRVGWFTFYMLPEPTEAWKVVQPPPDLMNTAPATAEIFNWLMGLPPAAVKALKEDDSGPFPRPLRHSKTKVGARIRAAAWVPAHKYLLGQNGRQMGILFQNRLSCYFRRETTTCDWESRTDLFDFVQNLTIPTSISTLFGTAILDMNPNLVKDFQAWNDNIPVLAFGPLSWLKPSANRSKKRMLNNIQKWLHALAPQLEAIEAAEEDCSWDTWTGSGYGRSLLKTYATLDPELRTPEGISALILGTIFAGTTNASVATFWAVFEVVFDRALFQRVRTIVDSTDEDDFDSLNQHPLLSSIFAETVRLHVIGLLLRKPKARDYELGGWTYPKDSFICASSRHGALNPDVWNSGTSEDPHPLDQFWADRFVIYPNKPDSGPLIVDRRMRFSGYKQINDLPAEGKFSTEGLTGAYLPFSGGPSECPGRELSRSEVILFIAKLIRSYDIELQTPANWKPAINNNFFPAGVLPPKDKVSFRLRLRKPH